MRNRKSAIPLEFLLTIILAVVVFGPTLIMINKCFRLSDEADKSYEDLLETIDRIAEAKTGEFDAARLYMDQGTAIVFIRPEYDYVTLSASGAEGEAVYADTFVELLAGVNARLIFERPAGCQKDKSCVFLCKEIKVSASGSGGWTTTLVVGAVNPQVAATYQAVKEVGALLTATDVYVKCEAVSGIKNVDYLLTGRCESPRKGSYYTECSGGVIFERGLVLNVPRLRGVEVKNQGFNVIHVEIPFES